jgi:hypothetical protein
MKFFTPDLLERFGSEDERIALAAHEEFERRSEAYLRHLHEIRENLPPRFLELQEQFYLHDARVMNLPLLSANPDVTLSVDSQRSGLPIGQPPPRGEEGRLPSFGMALQLDTPPKEVLVLQYRSVIIEKLYHQSLADKECPGLEWQYDEVDLIRTSGKPDYLHSILFTRGIELILRFKDFDFAKLKPMEIPQELAKASH